MPSNVVCVVKGAYFGFHATVATLLSSDHHVTVVTDSWGKRTIDESWPELASLTRVDFSGLSETPDDQIIAECLKREHKYGEFFSMIASYDRGWGKGYLSNVDLHPDIARAWWPRRKILNALLQEFISWEQIFSEISPDLVISAHNGKILSLVARHHGVATVAIINAKMGEGYLWADDEYLQSSALEERLDLHVTANGDEVDAMEIREYVRPAIATAAFSKLDFSYRAAIVASARRLVRALVGQARVAASRIYRRKWHRVPREGYHFLGWIPTILRKSRNYKLFIREGSTPSELAGNRIVFFPLHMEPEAALLSISPEFNNSMEMITWISKSLPVDTVLVVKEHPFSFGVRSRHFYNNLRRIENVALADPRIDSWDWIRAADVVTTATGTAAFEAVYFDTPVLSFGKHQVINRLPTVRFAHDYESTRKHLGELMRIGSDDERFRLAKYALHRAQRDVAFEMPNYENLMRDQGSQPELARVAIDKLMELYPRLLGKAP